MISHLFFEIREVERTPLEVVCKSCSPGQERGVPALGCTLRSRPGWNASPELRSEPTLHSGTDVPLKVAYPVRKKFSILQISYPVREKKSRVPLKLGGSVFEAAEGLREFRVPGTRFFFVRGGYAKKFFSRTPKMMVKS